jgi:hypothetical protein
MSLKGYATAVNQTNEVVCAYASGPYMPSPIPDPSPWVVIGSFTVPIAVEARLCVSGLNTGVAVLSVALFAPGLVSSSATTVSSEFEAEALSQPISLLPSTVYQIAVQYLGLSGTAAIRTVSLRSL